MWCAASDSWYSTSSPPASSRSRARRAKPISMTGSLRPCAMRTRSALAAGELGLPAVDRRDEAGEGEDRRGRRAAGPEAERVAHHRAHREAAEDGLLRAAGRSAPTARRGRRRACRRRRGTCRGRGSRRAARRTSGCPGQPGIVSGARGVTTWSRCSGSSTSPSGEQVVLVGAAAVVEDEQPLGRAGGGGPLAEDEVAHAATRGFVTGARICSSCARRCSCIAGRRSASPRCSGSSSTAKPGESVAISKSTPRGSRK